MKKVKGWVQCDLARNEYDHATEGGEVIYLQKHKELSMDKPAVLIVSDTQEVPVVFTAEEVKAKIAAERIRVQPLIEAVSSYLLEFNSPFSHMDNRMVKLDQVRTALTAYQNTER